MKDFKAPDLHAPRYRRSIVDVLNKEFYSSFRARFPEYVSMSDREIKTKVALINGAIWNVAIEEREGVELPNGLGYIFIGSCSKKKSDNTDYKTSKQYQKQIQHRNWESDGYIAKIFYTNYEQKYRFKFHELWGFKAVRQFKRTVSRVYPSKWNFYLMVDNFLRISKLFRKQSYKFKKEIEERELLKSYDELEID
jgi:hypothetical protein